MKKRKIALLVLMGVGAVVAAPALFVYVWSRSISRGMVLDSRNAAREYPYVQVASDRLRYANNPSSIGGPALVDASQPVNRASVPNSSMPSQGATYPVNAPSSPYPTANAAAYPTSNTLPRSFPVPSSTTQVNPAYAYAPMASNPAVPNSSLEVPSESPAVTYWAPNSPSLPQAPTQDFDPRQNALVIRLQNEKSPEVKKWILGELRKLLDEEFGAKMTARAARIASLQNELANAKRVMDSRLSRKAEIIDRRLAELTGGQDDLSWDTVQNTNVKPNLELPGVAPTPLFSRDENANRSDLNAPLATTLPNDDSLPAPTVVVAAPGANASQLSLPSEVAPNVTYRQSDVTTAEPMNALAESLQPPQSTPATPEPTTTLKSSLSLGPTGSDEAFEANDEAHASAWSVNRTAASVLHGIKMQLGTKQKTSKVQSAARQLEEEKELLEQLAEDAKTRLSLRRQEIVVKIRAKENELNNATEKSQLYEQEYKSGTCSRLELLQALDSVVQVKSVIDMYQQRLQSFDQCTSIMDSRMKAIEDGMAALKNMLNEGNAEPAEVESLPPVGIPNEEKPL